MIQNCIFDVDGTLIDPWVGATKSIHYAFERMGIPYDPANDSAFFIGPPIKETFQTLLPEEHTHRLSDALLYYRERFEALGIAECSMYDDMQSLLHRLSTNRNLFVATARLQKFTDLMLAQFEVSNCFTAAYGTQLDGTFNDKAHLLRHIIDTHTLDPTETVMIGDRMHDILAAKSAGIRSIGVSYGYGTVEELRNAGADWIVGSPVELEAILNL